MPLARSASLVRHLLALAVGFVVAATAIDAGARPGPGPRRFAARPAARAPAPVQRPQRAPEPVAPPVETQSEPVRPARPGRLTPDERRALRQQINDAGRDIYRPGYGPGYRP